MKICVVAPSPVPFVIGGAENLWWGLVEALNARPGVLAELLKLPSPERNMGELLASYRRFSELDLSHFDMVISTKYPAWAIRHPNHVVYLQHTLRGLYDCYPPDMPTKVDPEALRALGMPPRIVEALVNYRANDVEFDELIDALDAAFRRDPASPCWAFPGPVSRAVIRLLDAVAMRTDKIAHYAAISDVVAARDGYFPKNVKVAVHHHPTGLKGLGDGPQETIFSASRLDPAKRIDLIIEGYKASGLGPDVPLHIAGGGPDEARLRAAAGDHPGIRFLGRVPEAQLVQEYARAICVPFVPRDEDYGLITLEAMLCAKPVIATTDSGGPTELLEDGKTGLIVPTSAAAIGRAMRRLCDDRAAAAEMGRLAQARARQLDWNALCDALVLAPRNSPGFAAAQAANAANFASVEATSRPAAPAVVTQPAKPLIGVLNTYPIAPVVSGGKLRLFGLYSRLADQFDVHFINLTGSRDAASVRTLAPGFTEELVPKSPALEREEWHMQDMLGATVEDLAAALYPASAPRWLEAIDALARRSDVMVCSHPYTLPALREVFSGPFVYEAHNVEADLKADIYGTHQWAIDRVFELERRAVREAALVSACSPQDLARLQALYGDADDPRFGQGIVVANGIDVGNTPFREAERVARRRRELGVDQPLALFMGSAHGPNIDAARVVIEAAAQMPDVHFLLLGSVCGEVRQWERTANVGFAGVVSDAEKAAWLDVCDIGLNPVVSGSGTNLKLIEYAAAGVPVVSTEFGVRGIGFEDGQQYVRATGEDFALGIRTMLGLAADDREALKRRARSWVEANGDWQSIARTYAQSLTQLLA
ncbi:glycosyltransferase family 4 protein [Paraburkholderia unamae]|uniref:Glycosyltransferase involved in cell wall biosynthesis n=1 Tax=Paraburkholderia unamae TaxID=219649 RepID=A0ABX5KJX2_9BURK|nr:glycosyltransferase family 4 protein [Paraburkholderia unamae]PVX82159.1 glycosyltransferase involved in cell wall biosynthesis [Paraburkholderia unamae]